MDIDLLKSAPEDQMEMMMMMMQMDYNDVVSTGTPSPDFTHPNSSSNIPGLPQIMDPSSTFMDLNSNVSFSGHQETSPYHQHLTSGTTFPTQSQKRTSMAAMREMIFRIAAMQPINIDPESVKPPKRRNVKISKDPQSVAARHRRERISERIRILQRLVPGGTKMDTASMLDEAIHYVKFLKNQVQSLERSAANRSPGIGFPVPMSSGSYLPMGTKPYQSAYNIHHYA